jgi:predicted Zn-dependent peptidase
MIRALVSSLFLLPAVVFAADPAPGATADAAPAEAPAEVVPSGPDRSAPPAVPVPALFELPDPVEHQVGGVRVLHVQVPGVRKVALRVVLHRGAEFLDGAYTAQDRALGDLWSVATATYDPAELEEVLALHQIDLSSYVGYTRSGVDLSVPAEDLAFGLDLLESVVGAPSFPAKDVKRYAKENQLFLRTQAPFSQQAVSSTALTYGWYGPDVVYGTRVVAEDWVLSSDDLAARHARLLTESPVTVFVVGDVSWEAVEPGLTRMLEGVGVEGDERPEPAWTPQGGDRVLVFGVPGATQATVALRTAGPRTGDPDRQALEWANFALGGHFLSRLNRNLREENGWTYGIGSRYTFLPARGVWNTRVQVKTENVSDAIAAIEHEITQVGQAGPTPAEKDAMVRSEVQTWNNTFANADAAANFYEAVLQQQMSVAEARANVEGLGAIEASAAAAATKQWLMPGASRLWVVVGDLEGLKAEIAELGWTDRATFATAEEALAGAY